MKDYKQEYIRYKKMYLELKAIKEQQGGKQVFDGFKNMFKSAPTETPIESPVQMNPEPVVPAPETEVPPPAAPVAPEADVPPPAAPAAQTQMTAGNLFNYEETEVDTLGFNDVQGGYNYSDSEVDTLGFYN